MAENDDRGVRGFGDGVGLECCGDDPPLSVNRQGGSALLQVGTLLAGLRIPPMQQRVL